MGFRLLSSVAALLVFASFSMAADGGKAPQPGQLPTTQVGIAAANSGVSSSANGAVSSVSIANVDDRHDRLMNRLWITSIVAAVAGTSLDAASSWGKVESNSLLASSNGTFGGRGVAIKAGLTAAVIIPQICLRKRKEYRTVFTIGNFAEASVFTVAAVHNMSIPKAQQ